MTETAPRRLGSAHALAFLALVVALGGTLATAGSGPAPKRTVAYAVFDTESQYGGREGTLGEPAVPGRPVPVGELRLPVSGLYAVSAKLDVAKQTDPDFVAGTVTCSLTGGTSGRPDTSVVTVAPGQSENVSLTSIGRYRTAKLTCSSSAGPFVMSNPRMTAITLDGARTCAMNNSQGPTCRF